MSDLPPVGTRLHAFTRKGERRRIEAEIVMDSSSPLGRAVKSGGAVYPSLSAAANAYSRSPRNGWLWWRTEDGRPVRESRG